MKKLKKFLKKSFYYCYDFALSVFLRNKFYFSHDGYCPCCDKNVKFISTNSWLRDYFYCTNCYSIPRERALMLVIEKYYPDWQKKIIHESSPGDRGASSKMKLRCNNYSSSQFFPGKELGIFVENHRNENLESLTFDDNSIDIFITQDVFEHIYNPALAFKEIARVLKSGGAHIFTTPLVNKFNETEVWAELDENGKPKFLKTPEYHSNPVDPTGSPVTMHWGYDITDYIEKYSGLNSKLEYIDDLNFGVRAEFIEVIVSQKNS